MLTREAIDTGSYLQQFESMPGQWSSGQIAESLRQTLQQKPPSSESVWIFAYGSLMWNPMIECESCRIATLSGWQRSFCLDMTIGRATHTKPGRMLALRPGGITLGLALRVRTATIDADLRRIWIREMALGSYRPIWAPTTLDDGTGTDAIVFVADESREQFRADSSVETVAPLISSASGIFGTNADYLLRLQGALTTWGLKDEYVESIVAGMPDPIAHRLEWTSAPQALANER
jgi:glutathione-specific gamma-glutamylcyclotransferase